MDFDNKINELFKGVADFSEGIVFYSVPVSVGDYSGNLPLILVWLVVASLFFTLYLGFVNIRCFAHAIALLKAPVDENDKSEGQISRFQGLMTALSGTVGLGNIAGVAVAISLGGPGAMLWMMLMGLFGMSSKFAEVVMAVKYRVHASKEHPEKLSGGPMYYIKNAFDNLKIPYLGRFFALLFAVCCSFAALGAGSMFQANQSFMQFVNVTGGNESSFLADKGWLYGGVVGRCQYSCRIFVKKI